MPLGKKRTLIAAITLALGTALAVGGCATGSSATNRYIVTQRVCDSGAFAGMWWSLRCWHSVPLPAACERPGTEDHPECQRWAREHAGLVSDKEAAVLIGVGGI